jgi:metal-responsive CopG/Arc/MetJ family transcriptional regulator
VRLSITMDQDLVEEIDAVTSNRSAFLAEASRAELARRKFGKIPVYGTAAGREEQIGGLRKIT